MNLKKTILVVLYLFLLLPVYSLDSIAKTNTLTLNEYLAPINNRSSFEVTAIIDSTNLETREHIIKVNIKIKKFVEKDGFVSRSSIFTKLSISKCNKDYDYYTKEISTVLGYDSPIMFNYDQSWGKVCLDIRLFWDEYYDGYPYQQRCRTSDRTFFTLRTSTFFPVYIYVIVGVVIIGAIGSFFLYKRRKSNLLTGVK